LEYVTGPDDATTAVNMRWKIKQVGGHRAVFRRFDAGRNGSWICPNSDGKLPAESNWTVGTGVEPYTPRNLCRLMPPRGGLPSVCLCVCVCTCVLTSCSGEESPKEKTKKPTFFCSMDVVQETTAHK